MSWQDYEPANTVRQAPVRHFGFALTYADADRLADSIEEDENYTGGSLTVVKCIQDQRYYVIDQ